MMYTINDARRECKELLEEGYGFDGVRIFINDLRRGKDITKDEAWELLKDLTLGNFGKCKVGFGTY